VICLCVWDASVSVNARPVTPMLMETAYHVRSPVKSAMEELICAHRVLLLQFYYTITIVSSHVQLEQCPTMRLVYVYPAWVTGVTCASWMIAKFASLATMKPFYSKESVFQLAQMAWLRTTKHMLVANGNFLIWVWFTSHSSFALPSSFVLFSSARVAGRRFSWKVKFKCTATRAVYRLY